MPIADLFLNRDKPLPDVYQYDDIPDVFRVQVFHVWKETIFKESFRHSYPNRFGSMLIGKIRNTICGELGKFHLYAPHFEPEDDLVQAFLNTDDTKLVLTIIEMMSRIILGVKDWQQFRVRTTAQDYVDELNARFLQNGIGYQFDVSSKTIIRMTDQFTHQSAVQNALKLLTHRKFKSANEEFIGAFELFNEGKYPECLAQCGSSLESTIKIICSLKKWNYDQKDTARRLIELHIDKSGLPSFFKEPLSLIATMRNRLSNAHGAGTATRVVPEYYARYCLNATASSILLLVESAEIKGMSV